MSAEPTGTRRVVWVRHGQTVWNAERRWQGHSDIALSDLGVSQAREIAAALARDLADAPVCLVASDLVRAADTAHCIAEAFEEVGAKAHTQTDPRLREFASGRFEGKHRDEIVRDHAEDLAAFLRGDDVPVGGTGECPSQVAARVMESFTQWAERCEPDETLVMVGHGGALRLAAYQVLGGASTGLAILDNCRIAHVRRTPASGWQWEIAGWNLAGLQP